MKCPSCGKRMKDGNLFTHYGIITGAFIGWDRDPDSKLSGKKVLSKKMGIPGARLELSAARCKDCRTVAFKY